MSDTRDNFQRARSPSEKAVRREAILAAAAELLDQGRIQDVSLNAIAEKAGLSKPNLYRYFESREEVLLALFLDDLQSFSDNVVSRLAKLAPDTDVEAIASILVDAYAKRSRLCRFLGVIASVLEHNVSARVIEDVKRTSLSRAMDVANALHRFLPRLSVERCLWLNNMAALLVAGLWPPANPASAVSEVLAKKEFRALRPHFRPDLHEAIVTLIRGS